MAVTPQTLFHLRVGCDKRAPSRVRRALAGALTDTWIVGDVMLIASELVTNAVTHSGGSPEDELIVELTRADERLVVSVSDPGRSGKQAVPDAARSSAFGGTGLQIVEQLTSRWGAERGNGYRVWGELRVPLGQL